jgi:hypothetical protein
VECSAGIEPIAKQCRSLRAAIDRALKVYVITKNGLCNLAGCGKIHLSRHIERSEKSRFYENARKREISWHAA